MKHSYILAILCFKLLLLTGCITNFGETQNIYLGDFDYLSVQNDLFKVLSTNQIDLENGLPENTLIPEEENSSTRATVISASDFIFNYLDYSNRNKISEIVGTYRSVDTEGNDVVLSGKIIVPSDGNFKRIVLASHYTIGSNAECPSNAFQLEGTLAAMGYAVVMPDYLGYGVSADKIHPYLIREVTAINVIDMYSAVISFFNSAGTKPEHDDIILIGYSQGGANTMNVLHQIEKTREDIAVHRVFAGGGPYDLKATFEQYINDDKADYPCAVMMLSQAMALCSNKEINLASMLRKDCLDNIEKWINSKEYSTSEMNSLIGTKQTSKILTDAAFNKQGEEVALFYSALTENSIASYNWAPKAPCYIFHSINDNVVSFDNAILAKNRWQGNNVQFNFGMYGTHVATFLKFLSEVKYQLKQEND